MRPGYQEGGEPVWWWKVALHLDEAQFALANAMAHNVDDPRPVQALYDRLREGQAVLLEIFRSKGLLPGSLSNGRSEVPMPEGPLPGWPMPVMQGPTAIGGGEEAAMASTTAASSQSQPLVAESAVPKADQVAVAVEAEPSTARPPDVEAEPFTARPPEVTVPAVIATEAPTIAPPVDSSAESSAGR